MINLILKNLAENDPLPTCYFWDKVYARYLRYILSVVRKYRTTDILELLVYRYQDTRKDACVRVACNRILRSRGIEIPAGLGADFDDGHRIEEKTLLKILCREYQFIQ